VFVEWADRVERALPADHLRIELAMLLDGDSNIDARAITIAPRGDAWCARAERLDAALAPFACEAGR
jgi:tRNA A37 threonylcarbamoyladenosine biosynthesis protein TsaE